MIINDEQYKNIVESLYKLAVGYTETETTKDKRYNADTDKFEVVAIKESKKIIQPNVSAILKLLELKKEEDCQNSSEFDNKLKNMTKDELYNLTIELAEEIKKG